jgi:hypothetical protein
LSHAPWGAGSAQVHLPSRKDRRLRSGTRQPSDGSQGALSSATTLSGMRPEALRSASSRGIAAVRFSSYRRRPSWPFQAWTVVSGAPVQSVSRPSRRIGCRIEARLIRQFIPVQTCHRIGHRIVWRCHEVARTVCGELPTQPDLCRRGL